MPQIALLWLILVTYFYTYFYMLYHVVGCARVGCAESYCSPRCFDGTVKSTTSFSKWPHINDAEAEENTSFLHFCRDTDRSLTPDRDSDVDFVWGREVQPTELKHDQDVCFSQSTETSVCHQSTCKNLQLKESCLASPAALTNVSFSQWKMIKSLV